MSVRNEQPLGYEVGPLFPVLDTLRAVGAFAVLTTHVAFWSGDYLGNGVWGTLLSRLDVGVAVFFVLSGFLLTRPFLARAGAGVGQTSTRRYYAKRLVRIYPVYIVTVVAALTLLRDNRSAGAAEWIQTALMANIYVDPQLPHGLTQMWSLAVEVSFYALLPLLMLIALGRRNSLAPRRVLVLLTAMVGVSVAWHLSLAGVVARTSTGAPLSWLPAYLSWFGVGMAIALAHVLITRGAPSQRGVLYLVRTLGSMPGACWTLALGLLLVSATPLAGPSLLFVATPAESLTKHALYGAIGGLVVLTGVFPDARYASIMSWRPLRHLGHISYSIFCIHLPVISLVMRVTEFELFCGNGFQLWLLTAAVAILGAELLYRFVEKPAMRLVSLPRSGRIGSAPTSSPQAATTQS